MYLCIIQDIFYVLLNSSQQMASLCFCEDGFHGKDVHTLNKDGWRQQQQQQQQQ